MEWRKIGLWAMGLGLILAIMVVYQWPDKEVHVYSCNVGQGDASIITQGFDQILIDGGPKDLGVLECLADALPFWDRRIEIIVVSHPHSDHIGGIPEVLRRYQVTTLLMPNLAENSEIFKEMYQTAMVEGAQIITADLGQQLKIGELEIHVLLPDILSGESLVWSGNRELAQVLGVSSEEGSPDLNEKSVVVMVSYRNFQALFTGDISIAEENQIHISDLPNSIEWVKVAHHGSKTSSSEAFVQRIKPKVAVIEVGKKNRYGHPNETVIERWSSAGTQVYRTDSDGQILVSSNGDDGVIEVQKAN